MSIILHILTKDGIVAASDTRTTIRKDSSVRYDDTAEKTIVFPNRIVVSHCGDSMVTQTLSVTKFLLRLKDNIKLTDDIVSVPLKILNAYNAAGGKGDTVFLISGYLKKASLAYTYLVETKAQQVKLTKDNRECGASYGGITNIAHAIMNSGIDYGNLSIDNAHDLSKICIRACIDVSRFHHAQSIGGATQIYVIDDLHQREYWSEC